jgi:hypothetical protein
MSTASFLYNSAKESFLGGTNTIDLLNGRLGVALVRNTYTASLTHSTMTNIGTANIVKTSYLNTVGTQAPTQSSNITITNGVLGGPNLKILAVPGTDVTINAVILFQQDATSSTQVASSAARLIAYMNQASSGFPIQNPGGADITIVWDTGTNKIFAL